MSYSLMCKSKSGLGIDLDLSPIFIENGLDLNILKCGGIGLDLTWIFFEMDLVIFWKWTWT